MWEQSDFVPWPIAAGHAPISCRRFLGRILQNRGTNLEDEDEGSNNVVNVIWAVSKLAEPTKLVGQPGPGNAFDFTRVADEAPRSPSFFRRSKRET